MGFLSKPDLQKFPLSVALKHTALTWADMLWGYKHDLFYWSEVVEAAKVRGKDAEDFEEFDLVFSLAQADKSCLWKISEILPRLATLGHPEPQDSKQKFLYLSLAWAFENRHKYEQPLEAVSYIFADFSYPDEIAHFVPYMPPSDGYDPSKHSKKENHQRLLDFWLQYLCEHGYMKNS